MTEELQQACSRDAGQQTGSTWYEDEQEEDGSTRSLKRATGVKAGDYIVDGQQLKQTTAFRYLGSWQHESGDLDREI